MIELGQKVKDMVTGFTGITTARVEYGNGCVQFLVVPKMKPKDTECPKGQYIDVEQLSIVNGKPIKLNMRKEPSGGVRVYPSAR